MDIENPYGSDLAVNHSASTANIDDNDPDEDQLLYDEFRPPLDDGDEDEVHVPHHGSVPLPSADSSTTQNRTSRLCLTMPLWLDHHYKTVEDMLKKEIKQSTQTPAMPKCYEEQWLWVWDYSPFLTLLTQQNAVIEPSIFYCPAFFIWLLHCLLGDQIPCPQCKANGQLTGQGKTVFVQRLGWIGKARWVVDIN